MTEEADGDRHKQDYCHHALFTERCCLLLPHRTTMRCLQNAVTRRTLGAPSMQCSFRNKKRMRTVAAVLLAFVVLLLLFTPGSDVRCSGDVCKTNDVRRGLQATPLADRSSFVTTFPHRQWRDSSSVKRILRWTAFFDDPSWEDTDDRSFAPCAERRCTMTNDRSLLDQSDAVLFHAGAVFNFWRGHTMPDHRLPHQVPDRISNDKLSTGQNLDDIIFIKLIVTN